ncbi:unnamed protein product, partial [Prorocentrum cordatum]
MRPTPAGRNGHTGSGDAELEYLEGMPGRPCEGLAAAARAAPEGGGPRRGQVRQGGGEGRQLLQRAAAPQRSRRCSSASGRWAPPRRRRPGRMCVAARGRRSARTLQVKPGLMEAVAGLRVQRWTVPMLQVSLDVVGTPFQMQLLPIQAPQAKLHRLEAAEGFQVQLTVQAPPGEADQDGDRAGLPGAAGREAEQMVGGKLGHDVGEQHALSDVAGTAVAEAAVPFVAGPLAARAPAAGRVPCDAYGGCRKQLKEGAKELKDTKKLRGMKRAKCCKEELVRML